MATKVQQEKNEEHVSVATRINDFLGAYKVIIISACAVVLVGIAVLLAVTVITDNSNKKSFETIESAVSDWEEARSAEDKSGLAAKEDELIAALSKIAKSKNFAGSRASMTIAEIYFSRKDWKNAADNYIAAANAMPKAYSAGINWFNAGVCADELGNSDEAIEHFNKALALENFAMKPRAQFSIGRIEEQRGKTAEAITAYEQMSEKYPSDDWTSLAKSRLIALQLK
jgi:tetratricopeptide (TPR) repeat protein